MKWYYRGMKRKMKKFVSPDTWTKSKVYDSETGEMIIKKMFTRDGKLRK
jgi:hypothetical protein